MLSYGMSSKTANDKFYGGLKEYRTSEGKEEYVNYKGSVKQLAGCYPKENGKYVRELKSSNKIFANTFTEQACGGTVYWYLKGISYTNENGGTYIAKYEGWIQ